MKKSGFALIDAGSGAGAISLDKGFTLIELLVVIAIIALLLAVIIPSISKAKQIAAAAVCLSNNSQLAKSYYMYAEDNKGYLTDGKPATNATGYMNFTIDGVSHRTHCFVAIPLSEAGTGRHDTVQDEIRGFEKGGLWPYLMNPDVYHCPVDRRYLKPPTQPQGGGDLIGGYRSYSLGAVLSGGGYSETGTGESKAAIIKYSDFTSPGSKVVFLEEADQSGDNDNYWNMYLNAVPPQWWDPFAIVHNGYSTFGYADGHADRHKWTDRTMIKMSQGLLPKNQPADTTSDDYPWFKRSYIPGRLRP